MCFRCTWEWHVDRLAYRSLCTVPANITVVIFIVNSKQSLKYNEQNIRMRTVVYLIIKSIKDGMMVIDVDTDGIQGGERLVVLLFLVVKHVALDNEIFVILIP